jgi:hypothetical protein
MFDFLDTSTSQYRQHANFVDVSTNSFRSMSQLDRSVFPYAFVENVEPFESFTKEEMLSRDECEYLVWLAETTKNWPISTDEFWSHRNLGLLTDIPRHKFQSIATAKLVLSVHQKIKEFVSKSFNTECYADQIGIVRWTPGSYQMPHIDEQDGFSRVAGCVVYLNDDYQGGHTYYPYYGKSHIPKTGKVFAHSSGMSHLHGVTKILGKTRYTIASTWSINKEHSNYENNLKSLKGYLEAVGQQELPADKRC